MMIFIVLNDKWILGICSGSSGGIASSNLKFEKLLEFATSSLGLTPAGVFLRRHLWRRTRINSHFEQNKQKQFQSILFSI